jgi:hypothetical protein
MPEYKHTTDAWGNNGGSGYVWRDGFGTQVDANGKTRVG